MSRPPTVRRLIAGLAFLGTCGVLDGLSSGPRDGELLIVMVLIASPFLVLAVLAGDVSNAGFTGLLVVLLAGTAFGLYAASSSSTGGLAFVWLLPLELLFVTIVGLWLVHRSPG